MLETFSPSDSVIKLFVNGNVAFDVIRPTDA